MLCLSGCRSGRGPASLRTGVATSEDFSTTEVASNVIERESPLADSRQPKFPASQVSYQQPQDVDSFNELQQSNRRTAIDDEIDSSLKELTLEDDLAESETAPEAPGLENEAESAVKTTVAPITLSAEAISQQSLQLESVLSATIQFYPEIDSAIRELTIAEGKIIQAQGGFDTKLKASSENTPVGFYETYRSNFGIEQPTFNGGSVFAGYRFGRGDFEPWYLERNTNELGELKLGANWALLRGKQIDARRVGLWQADLKRQSVEPVVRQQLLLSLRDAEVAYWNWVAAGQTLNLNQRLLEVANNRVDGINERIKAGDLAEINRTDNDRSILSRKVKLVKARAKLEQAAIKLSLYYRDANGTPIIPTLDEVPELNDSNVESPLDDVSVLVANAVACRPEVNLIALDVQNISLDLAKARNDLLPELNARFSVSQDFGDPTSASAAASSSTQTLFVNFDEKDEFQVDASLFVTQSLQRRKASGKIRSLSGKLEQLQIKQKFLQQKIEAEVRQNYQLTAAANEQIQVAEQSLRLARQLSAASRERYEDGDVDLFEIILREKQELDSAGELIGSQFNFYANRANLNASLGCNPDQLIDRLIQ